MFPGLTCTSMVDDQAGLVGRGGFNESPLLSHLMGAGSAPTCVGFSYAATTVSKFVPGFSRLTVTIPYPGAVNLNQTELVSWWLGSTKHVPDSLRSPDSIVAPTVVLFSGPRVVFGHSTISLALAKLSLPMTPVPYRATVCGLPGALVVTLSRALRAPAAVGLNQMVIPQLAPGARLAPQLL